MWHSEWGLLLCTAGIAMNLWGATKGKQFAKADTEQIFSHYIFYNVNLCYNMRNHKHTQTHARTHTHTPDED